MTEIWALAALWLGRALIAAAFLLFLGCKIAAKIAGIYPVTRAFGQPKQEGMYTTLLMSTGLTFGTISSLFGLSHGIIDVGQYSSLVAAVVASAVVPTLIANAGFLPRHLVPRELVAPQPAAGESVGPAPTGTVAPISAPSSLSG